MISFYAAAHTLHAPAIEFFRGERVACFESPARAQFACAELGVNAVNVIEGFEQA